MLARELKGAFDGFLREEYSEQFIRSLEKEVGVRRNEAAITRAETAAADRRNAIANPLLGTRLTKS